MNSENSKKSSISDKIINSLTRNKEINYLFEDLESIDRISIDGKGKSIVLVTDEKVLYPGLMLHLSFNKSNKKRIDQLNEFYKKGIPISIILRKNFDQNNDISIENLYKYGTIAEIVDLRNNNDSKTHIVLRGKNKFKLKSVTEINKFDFLLGDIEIINESNYHLDEKEQIILTCLKDSTLELLQKDPEFPQHAEEMINGKLEPIFLAYFATSISSANNIERQMILEESNVMNKIKKAITHILLDIDLWKLRQSIKSKVYKGISDQQKEIYIKHEIEALKKEIGDNQDCNEIDSLIKKAKNKKWTEEAQKHFENTIKKLEKIPPNSPEYPIYLNQATFFVELPWKIYTKDSFDLKKTQEILNKRHYGMEKVKDRILEYLAVLKLKGNMKKSPILCLCGPPGVGKTSLGKSIAEALDRKYTKVSLGGIYNEADIRGHRKTYIGAMPGKIMHNIKLAGSSNPVFLLDEIDKVDSRNGAESALLELLDPEQNNSFFDNFVEVPYDLSKILFIATANYIDDIPLPLRDRMEIVNINGYTTEEKVEIAKNYIFPEQRVDHGLKCSDIKIKDKALEKIIEDYTCESGVRDLQRKLAKINRKVAKSLVLEEDYRKNIGEKEIKDFLGTESFYKDKYEKAMKPGIAIGLAYTPFGGEILFVESTAVKGKGEVTISGQLGDVMKESAMAAISYLKTKSEKLKLDYRIFDKYDLHIHLPDGATPKDGPSAGITLATALASLYTQRKLVDKISMTGEITLRGQVLPVGGIKEKILAAKRAGIKKILLSEKNRKDIKEIKPEYLKDLIFEYVNNMDEVLEKALQKQKCKNAYKWNLK
ncbi:MAG: endopeptidase La [Bacteroidetes bacterium]|nr:endopeptidase La [Bacteroidota bacterium]